MRILSILTLLPLVSSLHLDISGRSLSGFHANILAADDHSDSVASTSDILYIANVTIDGVEYPLQMDTGSSDLWVDLGQTTPSNVTTTMLNMTYGTGYAYGPIATGPVEFAGYEIPSQAYLVFQSGENPVLHFGAVGIVGLGFTGLSHIDAQVDTNGATWGRSLLYNIFALNPTEPNYIAMALERVGDTANTVQGSLGVGEVADAYANITSTAHIPLFPPQGSTRWTILLDSFAVNGAEQTVSSVIADAPAGRAAVLLDSGTTYSYAPPSVANAIYSGVTGAVLNTTLNQWTVPCSAGIRLTLWIGGQPFDIHPLDVVLPSIGDPNTCIGSFMPTQLSVGSSSFDWILGTNVLRSLYTLYDFGDFDSNNVMGDPYVQLLSVVDINAAASDFQSTRGGTVNVDNGDGNASAPVTVETSDQKIDSLMNMIPLLFAVLGANALILLTLFAAAIWLCCYLRKQKRKPKNKLAPLQLSNIASRDHAYEAVATNDVDEAGGRPSSIRPLSRTASKQSLSSRSIRDGIPELGHHSNTSHSSLLRPSINISSEDVSGKRSSRVPFPSGGDSRRSSRLTPPRDSSPNLAPQRHSRIPSNLVPASPSPTAPGFAQNNNTTSDEGLVDVSLVPHEEAGDMGNLKADLTGKHLDLSDDASSTKKRYTFEPPPPISIIGPGMSRQSMASDMSASPTVAGSDAHFALGDKGLGGDKGRERTMSAYYSGQERPNPSFVQRPNSSYVPERPARGSSLNSTTEGSPLRQSSLNSTGEPSPLRQTSLNSATEPSPLRQSSLNASAEGPSPTESQYLDARQSYYSHPNYSASNGSLSAFPVPPETPATGRMSMMMTPNSATPNSSMPTPLSAVHPAPPMNTPITPVSHTGGPVDIVVEEPGLGYLQEETPTQSPSHRHSRMPSQGQGHARTSSQGRVSSGSHSRSSSQTQAQLAAQAQAQRQQQQEAQRAAFMAALDEPLPAPRRPRVPGSMNGVGGGLNVAQDPQMRMSAYHLNPAQESYNSAQLNRYSYAPGGNGPNPNANGNPGAGFAGVGVGQRGFQLSDGASGASSAQRSSYVSGSPARRGPFLSNPSPFNPAGNAPSRAPPQPPA